MRKKMETTEEQNINNALDDFAKKLKEGNKNKFIERGQFNLDYFQNWIDKILKEIKEEKKWKKKEN